MKIITVIILIVGLVTQFVFTQEKSNEVIAFKNVNLIPMTSEKVVPGQTVVIKKDRIMEIGESEKVNIPEDAFIIDGTGKYLLPGLADMHTHYGGTLEKSDLNLFVAYGVTTIRDLPQGSPPTLVKLREEIKEGKRFGPQIFVANHIMGIEIDPSQSIQSSKNSGYDGVKLNSYFTTKEFIETVTMADKSGVYTCGHLPFLVSFDDVLNSGFKESSHVLEVAWYLPAIDIQSMQRPDSAINLILQKLFEEYSRYINLSDKEIENIYRPRIKVIVDKIGERDFSFSTTLIADYDIMNKVLNIDTIKNSSYSQYISKAFWDDIKAGKDKHFNMFPSPNYAAMVYKTLCMILHELIDQKKFLVLGTDVGPTYLSYIPGLSVHQELKLLVDNGLTPYQALLTATKNAAIITNKMCGVDNFGTIEVGKKADLLLLENNPLIDITNTQKIHGVFIQGEYYKQDKLDSIKNIQKQNIGNLVMDRYKKGGIDEAIKLYHSLKNDNYFNKYYYSENTLIILAYELLKMNSLEDALKLFLLNVEEYPNAPNSYDSLGEVYLKMDKKQLAIDNYKKALSMDPNFENSIKVLKKLEK
jgi:hypothetical protein